MTESNTDTDNEAIRAWYKSALDKVVREMVKIQAITGAAVDAAPMWMVPYKILIARVWDSSQKTQFIWTISGDGVTTDHVPGSMATTPQDVAKHFSMKWQLDADNIMELAKSKAPGGKPEPHMEAHAQKLIEQAENLYGLTMVDDYWKPE